MTSPGTIHPQVGSVSITRWLLTGATYKHRFTLASLGWIWADDLTAWYFDGSDVSDYAIRFAKSIRGARLAKRYVVRKQQVMAI